MHRPRTGRAQAISGTRNGTARALTTVLEPNRAPPLGGARGEVNRRRPTLPGPCGPSTIGAEGLNCSVRNGKRCFPLAIATGNGGDHLGDPSKLHRSHTTRASQSYPSSPRPISTSLLRASPPFQSWPINLVVYQGSYSL